MNLIHKMLSGGDKRSIAGSNEVAALVLEAPNLMEILMAGMMSGDPILRMRCADAAEKVTAVRPELLRPYKSYLIWTLAGAKQKELRWHVAPMLARLPLTASEQSKVFDILLAYMTDGSSLVKALTMQALADLAARDERLLPETIQHLRGFVATGTPAMKTRGRRLLLQLGKQADGPGQPLQRPSPTVHQDLSRNSAARSSTGSQHTKRDA
jgi:hypothetical protein